MPYVPPEAAINERAINLDATVPPLDAPLSGGLPGRRPLIANNLIRCILLHWPVGFVTVPHYHPRALETFHILRGEALFRFGDEPEPRRIGPGTLLHAPPGLWHTIAVPGPEPLLFWVALTPNEDAPDETIEDPNGPGITLKAVEVR